MTIVPQDIQRVTNLLLQRGFARDEIMQLYRSLLVMKEEELRAIVTELLEAMDDAKRQTSSEHGSEIYRS
jgi:hypothetical protein